MDSTHTVPVVVRSYLSFLESMSSPSLRSYRSTLLPFAKRYRRVKANTITVEHVIAFLDGMNKWKPGTRCTVWGRIKTCWSHDFECGKIRPNHLEGKRRPAKYPRSIRGSKCVLPSDLHSLLFEVSGGRWRDFLLALSRTGARPGELAHAVTANYSPQDHAIIHLADEQELYRHKTACQKKSGQRDRVIYLDAQVEDMVAAAAGRDGYLLPAEDGGRWTPTRIRSAWKAMLANPKVKEWMEANNHIEERVVPYSFRHTWITRALEKGTPLVVVADLCGTSAAMVEKHYCHVGANRERMRRAYLSSL